MDSTNKFPKHSSERSAIEDRAYWITYYEIVPFFTKLKELGLTIDDCINPENTDTICEAMCNSFGSIITCMSKTIEDQQKALLEYALHDTKPKIIIHEHPILLENQK